VSVFSSIAADKVMEVWKKRRHLKLVSLLGKGQFGGVYRAVDTNDGNEYAVKVISLFQMFGLKMDLRKPERGTASFERDVAQLQQFGGKVINLVSEVRKMRWVTSKNIVQFIEHWFEGPNAAPLLRDPVDTNSMSWAYFCGVAHSKNNFLYIQMELCDMTLKSWIEEQTRAGQHYSILKELRCGALLQITAGLSDLHKQGILHCDLKPDNILLQMRNGEITFKIGDFGNSRMFETQSWDFQSMVQSDVEHLAIRVYNIILQEIQEVKSPGEFHREQSFVDCVKKENKIYFTDCSCTFLLHFLNTKDDHVHDHILQDTMETFVNCYHCVYAYWNSHILSKYQEIDLSADIFELKMKTKDIEHYRYQIMVNNEADARYSANIVKGCLQTAGLKVVTLEYRKFLELHRQGLGSTSIDFLRDSGTDLLVLLCGQLEDTDATLLIQMCERLDYVSVNTLLIAGKDMTGKHGVLLDLPTINWEDLACSTRILLLRNNINLQGRAILLGSFVDELDSESLRMVLSDSKGELNIPLGTNSVSSVLPQPYIHRKFQLINSGKQITDTEIIKSSEKLWLISDGPGMGKSTVLVQLCQTLREFNGMWCHIVQLNRFFNDLVEWNASSEPVETLLVQMLKENLRNGELQPLFEATMEGRTRLKLVLFLDALDEVAPDSYENVASLVQQLMRKAGISKIVLTSRTHLFKELQQSFGQEAINVKLVPLGYPEQHDYLQAVWGDESLPLVDPCIKTFEELLGKGEHSPICSPLLLRMLAEQTKHEKYLSGSIHEFYSVAVDRKIAVSIEDKFGLKSEGSGVGAKKEVDKIKSEILTCLQWLAMSIIRFKRLHNFTEMVKPTFWDEDRLRRTLLVEGCGENIYFVHRTFAEYFFGLYLANKIDSVRPEEMAELAFSPAMEAVRNIFDFSVLHKYFTEHSSVIFWNCIINEPEIFASKLQPPGLRKRSPWEAVLLRSLLQHCHTDVIVQILNHDEYNSLIRKSMDEWRWSLQQIREKVCPCSFVSHFVAQICFNKLYHGHPTHTYSSSLWTEALTSEPSYVRILWEWLCSNPYIEKEEKVELLLRGNGLPESSSMFYAVRTSESFKFFTGEVLMELSLSPKRIREELMLVGDTPAPNSNLLHAATHFSANKYPLSLIREFIERYLSKEDLDTLLFQSLFKSNILIPLPFTLFLR
jgi:serine/threonine protein kinase